MEKTMVITSKKMILILSLCLCVSLRAMSPGDEAVLEKAKDGDARSQFFAAGIYLNGYEVEKDYQEAIRWYEKSASQGYVDAQERLGELYFEYEGVKTDYVKAYKWFWLASETKDDMKMVLSILEEEMSKEQLAEAKKLIKEFKARPLTGLQKAGKSKAKILAELTVKAEAGDLKSQYELGYMYRRAKDVDFDHNKAYKWLKQAAEKGHMEAQYELGDLLIEFYFFLGESMGSSMMWLEKAAGQGCAKAYSKIGYKYQYGKGVKVDLAKAKEYYKKATDAGDAVENYNQGCYYYHGGDFGVDHDKALKYFTVAANKKFAPAEYMLGAMYDRGQADIEDEAKAVYWLKRAALQGHSAGEFNLGMCYLFGEGVKQDKAEAVRWLKKAVATKEIDRGEEFLKYDYSEVMMAKSNAFYFLADIYYKGDGVEKDKIKAYMCLSLMDMAFDEAKKLKAKIEKELTAGQLGKAKAMVTEYRKNGLAGAWGEEKSE